MCQFPPGGFTANKLCCWPIGRRQNNWPPNSSKEDNMRLGIATDHGGFGLKEELVPHLKSAGHEVVDYGAHSLNPGDDYPDFVIPLAQAAVPETTSAPHHPPPTTLPAPLSPQH